MTRAVAALVVLVASLAGAAPRSGARERIEHRDPAAPPSRGPRDAPVTVELFFVPGSSMPSNALRQLEQLQARHPARVRVIYRVLKSGSVIMVPIAALEAQAAGRFFDFLDELARQRNALKKDELLELARKVGVAPQRVDHAIDRELYNDVLEANQRRFERLHAVSAPVVIVNGRIAKLLLANATTADFEREYIAGYARALDKLDRGYAAARLLDAFDDEAMTGDVTRRRLAPPDEDDEPDRPQASHPLASPPLALDGLPAFGRPGTSARVPIAVLCRPNDDSCGNLLRVVEPQMRLNPDDVRVVWAPWFDVARDDATDLALLGDAALCAEAVGSNQGELTASPGWRWLREMYAQGIRRGRGEPVERVIDAVARKLALDIRAMSRCRASMAGASLAWVAAARRAGVARPDAALVIGGRIYTAREAQPVLAALVEAELAPGVLGSLPRWSADNAGHRGTSSANK